MVGAGVLVSDAGGAGSLWTGDGEGSGALCAAAAIGVNVATKKKIVFTTDTLFPCSPDARMHRPPKVFGADT
jgi:hypothetical protein